MFSFLLTVVSIGFILVTAFYITKLYRVIRLLRFRPVVYKGDLPTVSVCIPARNERHAMTACLEGVLASDYEKLEIIVLDDSSVDETSVLIKSFAHAGVRFVEGSLLPKDWLGKNHALEGLLQEASGQYVLFMDVDAIVKPSSISELVNLACAQESNLISVLAVRDDMWRASVIFGSLRYFWALLRNSHRNPAVSSVAWLASRDALLELGGFATYKQSVQPEEAIAADMKRLNDQQLVISTKLLGFSYEKKWSSQLETSIRLLKPIIGGNVKALGMALGILCYVTVPFLLISSVSADSFAFAVAICQLFSASLLFSLYFKTVWRRGWWLGGILWPLIVTQEGLLIIASLVQYGRNQVTWKGRLVSTASAAEPTSYSSVAKS